MAFNPDSTGVYNGNYFGFEFSSEESTLSLMSIPWDATVSYRAGTSSAPEAIIEASTQVEIYDSHFTDQWQRGITTLEVEPKISEVNDEARLAALRVINHIEAGGDEQDSEIADDLKFVNECSEWLNTHVYNSANSEIEAGRVVGLVGGDHSTPLGLISALSEHHKEIGILHIDAHMDLRDGYEGFTYSHASIMRRSLELRGVKRLTQVAVRDYSATEAKFAAKEDRVRVFSDQSLFEAKAEGKSWAQQCSEIIDTLPQKVYISFDIDGLEQSFCPATGTPVPGGLTFNEAIYLLVALGRSGRQIVGFDLTEVTPSTQDEWNAIVGARVLYKLCNLALATTK